MFRPKHVAQNIIVALDFDGTVADDAQSRVAATWALYKKRIDHTQIARGACPLPKDEYSRMTTLSGTEEYVNRYYQVFPHVRRVLKQLYALGFRFVIMTSRPTSIFIPRNETEKAATARQRTRSKNVHNIVREFIKKHDLPIMSFYNTPSKSAGANYFRGTTHVTKGFLCKKLSARIMLENSLPKLQAMHNLPIQLCFLRTPSNGHELSAAKKDPLVHVMRDWINFEQHCLFTKTMHEAICLHNGWPNDHAHVEMIGLFWRRNPALCKRLYAAYERRVA